MKEINENNATDKNRWKPGKSKLSRFLSTVGAGVIGSVLTLTVVTNTSMLEKNDVSGTNEIPVVQTDKDQSYNVAQTSANSASLADMVEHASKSIVGVVNYKYNENRFARDSEIQPAGSGSGVIFKKEGDNAYIVTNNHVIEGAEKIEVTVDNGDKIEAELVGADALSDLAVLKVDAKYAEQVLEFGDSDQLRAGDEVIAIGNPLGLDLSRTVTQGIVSAVNRSVNVSTSAGEWDLNVIQTDAAINPGNSGGALINAAGQLIGINSLKIADNGVEGLGFAIPVNDAKPLIDEMIAHGKIERPYMGIGLADLDQVPQQYVQQLPLTVEGGVMVANIDPESSAAKAGLNVQDVIVSINDKEVKNSRELRKLLYTEYKVGDTITLDVYRGSEVKTMKLTLTGK
ncbi:trypsin-like peptidase domain-containing protein [Bacillus sp. FJAT-50079]|uniref:S1C family serine protease n=1 Tax=Bacillus sp. FJAT-50079 TaxID=2833577 RepID=UPI001BC9C578|nr:trypsin-like peptidase domain-containing protein [Bacillus sp. FJAT-50079]MBS4210209.1 trypsin-like peptidase domain-containing protein [Bacillus sp. FJAT-50079]